MFRVLPVCLIFFACAVWAEPYVDTLKKAAEQGDAKAQYQLGFKYDYGIGVAEDDTLATEWYRKAAEQGEDSAQFFLGFQYFEGAGVPKDDVQAYAWVSLAAAQGIKRAQQVRERIAEVMTKAQISRAQELSRKYWEAYGPGRKPND